ncbi:hypothetical protein AB0E95_36240 [Streptomyces massasporeus]
MARKVFAEACASGHVRDAITKANRILAGTDPSEVLPMHIKTGASYLRIADPENPDVVVIDRHAHDIAVREIYGQRDRELGAVGRYHMLPGSRVHLCLQFEAQGGAGSAKATWCIT